MVQLELDVKREIVRLHLDDNSNAAISRNLGPSRSTVARVLKEYNMGAFKLEEDEDVEYVQPTITVLSSVDVYALDVYAQSQEPLHEKTEVGERYILLLDDITDVDGFFEDEWIAPYVQNLQNEGIHLVNTFQATGESEDILEAFNHPEHADYLNVLKKYAKQKSTEIKFVNVAHMDSIIQATKIVKFNSVPCYDGLRALSGVPRQQVAEEVGVSTSSVNRCVKRVLAGLRAWFETTPLADFLMGDIQQQKSISKKDIATQLKSTVQSAPYKYIIDDDVIMIVKDGKPNTINTDHPNFELIFNALNESRWDDAIDAIDVKTSITKYSQGAITVDNGVLLLDGERPLDGRLGTRIVEMLSEGKIDGVNRLAKFLEKMDNNPSNQITSRIYDFLKFNDITIDEDGDIIAFKVVNNEYKDLYTRTMDNSVGTTVEVKRHRVDENMNQTCSYGLHVCAIGYISQYSGNPGRDRVVKVKMNPADVVAIPKDYGDAKVRCCKYTVIEDVTQAYLKGQIERMSVDMDGIYRD